MKLGKIIDLSMALEKGMRLFPGIPEPTLTMVRTHDENGLQVSKLETVVHAGTHVDSARHVIENRETVSDIDMDRLIGSAIVLNLKHIPPGNVITENDLSKYSGDVKQGDIVVLNTGYEKYNHSENYCTVSPGAAHWLVQRGIKCLAVDLPSLDPLNRTGGRASEHTHPTHHIILGAGIPLVEFLVNLDALQERIFIICLPLKISGSDAAPARVIAFNVNES